MMERQKQHNQAAIKSTSIQLISIWYEPTNSTKATKPFGKKFKNPLWFISPNFNELCKIATELGINITNNNNENLVTQTNKIAKQLLPYVNNVMVTLGKLGSVIVSRKMPGQPVLNHSLGEITCRYYPAPLIQDIVSVSGAGDCLAAGFLGRLSLDPSVDEPTCVMGDVLCQRIPDLPGSCAFKHLFLATFGQQGRFQKFKITSR